MNAQEIIDMVEKSKAKKEEPSVSKEDPPIKPILKQTHDYSIED